MANQYQNQKKSRSTSKYDCEISVSQYLPGDDAVTLVATFRRKGSISPIDDGTTVWFDIDGVRQSEEAKTYDGKAELEYRLPANHSSAIKVEATADAEGMPKARAMWKPDRGVYGNKVKFVGEKVEIGKGTFRLQLNLADEESEKGVPGEVRLSSTVPFMYKELDGEYEHIAVDMVRDVKIPDRGMVAFVKLDKPGDHKLDVSIIGWPVQDADIKLSVSANECVKPTDTPTPAEELFAGFQ